MTTTFHTRLRGVEVECQFTDDRDLHVTVTASTIAEGLPKVSRFAGYCARTLNLANVSDDGIPWACTVADYYGFGLSRDGEMLVEPRTFAPIGLSAARARFNGHVHQIAQPTASLANDSAHV